MQSPNFLPVSFSLQHVKQTAGENKKYSILFLFAFSTLFSEFTHNQNRQREQVMDSKVKDVFGSDTSFQTPRVSSLCRVKFSGFIEKLLLLHRGSLEW